MRRVYALSFVLLNITFNQRTGVAIPGCVNDCLTSTTAGCDSGDIACLFSISKRKEFIAELSSCIKKGCKADEVAPAEDLYGPLCAGASGDKADAKEPTSTAEAGNAPAGGAGQGDSAAESSATSNDDTEEMVSTDDTVTSTSEDPVKGGAATAVASVSTERSASQSPAQTGTKSSTASSTSTEEVQATETENPAIHVFSPSGGLSAGAKVGIGVGVAFGVIVSESTCGTKMITIVLLFLLSSI